MNFPFAVWEDRGGGVHPPSLGGRLRLPMSVTSGRPPLRMAVRSVFDAGALRSEFESAGISTKFLPFIWRYLGSSLWIPARREGGRGREDLKPCCVCLRIFTSFLFSLCRHVLDNPNCDLEDVPSLPSAAYPLLRGKFRSMTSSVASAVDSADGRTTKLLVRLQVAVLLFSSLFLLFSPIAGFLR